MICYREDFNTSHVTVYRIAFILGNEVSVISIHPMLRFIDYGAPTMRKRFFNFNTSHVTVYQNPTLQPKGLSSFQYIPCYGLSMEQRRIIVWLSYFNTSHVTVYPAISADVHAISKFQYIPCYGLSGLVWRATFRLRDFNTSHVTVYLMLVGTIYV